MARRMKRKNLPPYSRSKETAAITILDAELEVWKSEAAMSLSAAHHSPIKRKLAKSLVLAMI